MQEFKGSLTWGTKKKSKFAQKDNNPGKSSFLFVKPSEVGNKKESRISNFLTNTGIYQIYLDAVLKEFNHLF